MKFGGSSVESGAAIQRVARIVAGRLRQRPLVVVSAMGKTTDRLVELSEWAAGGHRKKVRAGMAALEDLHLRESSGLEAVLELHFSELRELLDGLAILRELTPRASAAIMSYGERLSSLVGAHAVEQQGLPAAYDDARRCLSTDDKHT